MVPIGIKLFVFILLVISCDLRVCAATCSMDVFDDVASADEFDIKWKVNRDDATIDIFIQSPLTVPSSAWLAVGISEVGGMLGSDIVSVEFTTKGGPIIVDRYVPWVANPIEEDPRPLPLRDAKQDWTLVCGSLSNPLLKRQTNTQFNPNAFTTSSRNCNTRWFEGFCCRQETA